MPDDFERVRHNARVIIDAIASVATRHPVIIIDGPSGAGKSTTADAVLAAWRGQAPTLVRMDDIYPGWHGLADAGDHIGKYLLRPLADGRAGQWQRYDWRSGERAEWHTVPAGSALLIEGCGALTRHNAQLATLRVWLDGAESTRKRRALERDRGGFDAHWDEWSEQMAAFTTRERPQSLADLLLSADA